MRELRWVKLWLTLGWMGVIVVIYSSLSPPMPATVAFFSLPYGDKIAHFTTYFILMGWFAQIYHQPKQRLGYMIGFILLGITLEIGQGFSETRQADWVDGLANSLGVWLAWHLTKRRFADILWRIEKKSPFLEK